MKKILWITLGVLIITWLIVVLPKTPSNNRNWVPDQATLPYAEFKNSTVTIHNVRNTTYRTDTDFDVSHYNKTYDLEKIERVWFATVPFTGFVGAAHTMLSFEFSSGEFVTVSVEIRKEKGESFSAVKGLFRNYEIIYVVADERDAIQLRTNYQKDQVYLYPMTADRGAVRELFVNMLNRANELHEKPEFYNTLVNNCTTNIVKHVNTLTTDTSIQFHPEILFPAYADKRAYDLGLIDTNLSFPEARAKFNINARAERAGTSTDFSKLIRE